MSARFHAQRRLIFCSLLIAASCPCSAVEWPALNGSDGSSSVATGAQPPLLFRFLSLCSLTTESADKASMNVERHVPSLAAARRQSGGDVTVVRCGRFGRGSCSGVARSRHIDGAQTQRQGLCSSRLHVAGTHRAARNSSSGGSGQRAREGGKRVLSARRTNRKMASECCSIVVIPSSLFSRCTRVDARDRPFHPSAQRSVTHRSLSRWRSTARSRAVFLRYRTSARCGRRAGLVPTHGEAARQARSLGRLEEQWSGRRTQRTRMVAAISGGGMELQGARGGVWWRKESATVSGVRRSTEVRMERELSGGNKR